MLLVMYLLGIIVALIIAALLKRTLFKGMSAPFVMELPTYKLPSVKGILIHTWEKVKGFIKKAATIILAAVVIIWVLSIFPLGVAYGSQQSILGMIGSAVAPIFAPLGFGTWQAAVAIIAGLLAKEAIVGTLGTLGGLDEDDEEGITSLVHDTFTPLSAFSFMAFSLLYIPCIAVLGVIKQETGTFKWPVLMTAITLVTAYVVTFLIYNIGTLMGFG
jgi:ferrous iron transport protein B